MDYANTGCNEHGFGDPFGSTSFRQRGDRAKIRRQTVRLILSVSPSALTFNKKRNGRAAKPTPPGMFAC
jgi:hypothetical protein